MDTQYAEKFQCIRDATFIAVTWQVVVAEHISLLNQRAFYSNQRDLNCISGYKELAAGLKTTKTQDYRNTTTFSYQISHFKSRKHTKKQKQDLNEQSAAFKFPSLLSPGDSLLTFPKFGRRMFSISFR